MSAPLSTLRHRRITAAEAAAHDDGLEHPTLSEIAAEYNRALARGDRRRARVLRYVAAVRVLRAQRDARG